MDSLFDSSKVHNVVLTFTAGEFDGMQPAAMGGFGPPNQRATGRRRETVANLFGTQFPWAKADVRVNDIELTNIGVRYDGDMTYLISANQLKRPLAFAFDRHSEQQLYGVSQVQLHSMPQDPSGQREALAYAIFRASGVPAQRTAYAEVSMSVKDRFEGFKVGLYTIVEEVDENFLKRHFDSTDGLLLEPFSNQGLAYMGDSWGPYAGSYRPRREATENERARLISFARLVNESSDDEFQKQIASFLDIDKFMRYVAANALTANLQSFMALGHNYHLYLDPTSNKFHFIPGDLEYSFANLLLFGSPEELMDLSITKPYPGESKLVDRLLAIPEYKTRYLKLVKELTDSVFSEEELTQQRNSINEAIAEIQKQEAARAQPNQNGGFGGFNANGPEPPTIETFIATRLESVKSQLAGTSDGFVPKPFSFGGPNGGFGGDSGFGDGNGFGFGGGGNGGGGGFGGGRFSTGNNPPIDEATFNQIVDVSPGFDVSLFATPPDISYPVAIACEPSGAIYVAVDEQGSLGRTPGGGRILRCVDEDQDGKVDRVTRFAEVEHPRGVTYRDNKVWVMHPPTLSVFEDHDHDGIADEQKVLVTGLTTEQITERGGDHTTNCVRMGIDGWLYIGVGDYGIKKAVGADGTTFAMRGGGIVRVRPDGTELEIYCQGLRNPFDLAIDPFMNIFTRDNTNDGAGWDTRVSLLKQSALYGYTQLFANFTDETMPTLGTFGNSGGTGALFLQDPRWPEQYNNTLYTGDWGRSEVYRHPLAENGPTFDLEQDVFMEMPRATGMDIDASGRLYVASWRGGEASVYVGPNVGFVAQVKPTNLSNEPFPNLTSASLDQLLELLASPQNVTRLHAQGEVLARGTDEETSLALMKLAQDHDARLESRVAALFTLKQLDGANSHKRLTELAKDASLKEFALRALTDRSRELDNVTSEVFVDALDDSSPRVRAQAAISLGRLGDPTVANHLIPLATRTDGSAMPTQRPVQNQPDPGRVVPHLAVRALVTLGAVDACLKAIEGPHTDGALWALRYMHRSDAVEGLIEQLGSTRNLETREKILATLVRLHYREADYEGSWWGIRPDNTGPYYDRQEWQMTSKIREVLTTALSDADGATADSLRRELQRHQVELPGMQSSESNADVAEQAMVVVPEFDPNDPNLIGNLDYEQVKQRLSSATGDPAEGKALFKSQFCIICHTTTDGQTPIGPHLKEIGKRYKTDELIESILKPSEKLAQGYETYLFATIDGHVYSGFVVSERANSTIIRESDGRQREIMKEDIDEKVIQELSAMPKGLAANLTPKQLADLIAYLESLE